MNFSSDAHQRIRAGNGSAKVEAALCRHLFGNTDARAGEIMEAALAKVQGR